MAGGHLNSNILLGGIFKLQETLKNKINTNFYCRTVLILKLIPSTSSIGRLYQRGRI